MKPNVKDMFNGKKVLVTGGTGSIGSELVKQILQFNPDVVRVFTNDEDNIFSMKQTYRNNESIRFLIGDIRDKERLHLAMENIDIVYHAAALKHVPLCEYNPFEAVKTNVLGTQNVIETALACNVHKVINISTDKAVNPVNTMGSTKLLAEKLIVDANEWKGVKGTLFSSVRFGNVLFSRGSVIPLFKRQMKDHKTLQITDKDMTRFVMSISNTVHLVFKATMMAKGGEIFILKMPVVTLEGLAEAVIDLYASDYGLEKEDIKKKVIGPRPGEKKYEELMTESEAGMAFETEDMIIIPPQVVLPDIQFDVTDYPGAKHCQLKRYTSSDKKSLTVEQIKDLLEKAQSTLHCDL